uniref:Uncharacterized protein n=1 Tax=Arundo donax TaxID=35708 RepID=A0A0A9CCQ3_ARUDO
MNSHRGEGDCTKK